MKVTIDQRQAFEYIFQAVADNLGHVIPRDEQGLARGEILPILGERDENGAYSINFEVTFHGDEGDVDEQG